MIDRKCFYILIVLLIFVLTVNVYFIRIVVENLIEKTSTPPVVFKKIITSIDSIGRKINQDIQNLPSKYFKQNLSYIDLLDDLLNELRVKKSSLKNPWSISNRWPNADRLIPASSPELGTILEAMRKAKVLRADNAPQGTQLKLLLTLERGVKTIFKPQWYDRDTVIQGPVYYGKDRHNAEVVAFHLSSLIGFRRVPITVIRKIDLVQEIQNRASPKLRATMYQQGNDTCLYGVCYYCSPADPICARGNVLEGALILWLPGHLNLEKHRNPWQRTYKKDKTAKWELDQNYCDKLKESKTYSPKSSNRLLNLIDTSIFDFLMDNGDRHHYELPNNRYKDPAILLIDNGKSLANPDVDHFDILAPLYQCCMIRKTTWDRLKLMSAGSLSHSLNKLLELERIASNVLPLITKSHLDALDRRLLVIYSVVEYCLKKSDNVILHVQ